MTYHQGHTLVMGNLGNGLKVRHIVAGVSNGLDIDSFGPLIDGGRNITGTIAIDKLGRDTQTGEEDFELVVGTAVQVAGRDDVVPSMCQGGDGHELGRLAGRSCDGGNTTLQGSNALLEDIDRGVHDATVDVAEFLEAEKPRPVSGVIESVGCGGIDGHRAGIGRRVRLVTLVSVRHSVDVSTAHIWTYPA